MTQRNRLPRPATLLILGVLILVVGTEIRKRAEGAAPASDDGCVPSAAAPCPAPSPLNTPRTGELTPLSGDEVCTREAGALCDELADRGEVPLTRWPDDTRSLTIYVPTPAGMDPADAEALTEAAVNGIRAWYGHPFKFSVRQGRFQTAADVRVEWHTTLPENRLGEAGTWFRRSEAGDEYGVRALSLTTHDPFGSGRPLPPETVRLVAAHEMGHVMGLLHSADPRDVMYPTNTSVGLTVRDLQTIAYLYALPNGAVIRP